MSIVFFALTFLFSVDNIAELDILSQLQSANQSVSSEFATQLLDGVSALLAALDLAAVRLVSY